MTHFKKVCIIACATIISTVCQAQVGAKQTATAKQPSGDPTPITNQLTGQRITISEYSELTKADPFAYHLVPEYDEYGQPVSYIMRQSTAEEHEKHRFRDRDPAKQPKGGENIPPFAMTDASGKIYRSADLVGNVVVLSFWVSLDKSVWDANQGAAFAEALQPYQSKTGPVVLGVFNSELPKGADAPNLKTLPFKPIPNAYGFHNKYHITTIPTIFVIDKTGKVVANLQGPGSIDKLKQVLATIP